MFVYRNIYVIHLFSINKMALYPVHWHCTQTFLKDPQESSWFITKIVTQYQQVSHLKRFQKRLTIVGPDSHCSCRAMLQHLIRVSNRVHLYSFTFCHAAAAECICTNHVENYCVCGRVCVFSICNFGHLWNPLMTFLRASVYVCVRLCKCCTLFSSCASCSL